MTQPGAAGHQVPQDGLTKALRRIENLERTVREMRGLMVNQGQMTVPSGNSITIQSGAQVPVLDGSSNVVAMFGTISGVADIHALDPASGHTLPLGRFPFAWDGANDGGSSFTQSTINTWQAGPMSITVTVKTGALYVEAGAVITVVGSASTSTQAVMSWNVAGTTTVGPSLTRGFGAGVINGATNVLPGFGQASRGYWHTGLTPGSYTITDQYQTNISGSSYVGRSLFVIPV